MNLYSELTVILGSRVQLTSRRLTKKISYDPEKDLLIHVGDLVAKGEKHEEVLQWMNDHAIMGVRGNHDQPVSHVILSLKTIPDRR